MKKFAWVSLLTLLFAVSTFAGTGLPGGTKTPADDSTQTTNGTKKPAKKPAGKPSPKPSSQPNKK